MRAQGANTCDLTTAFHLFELTQKNNQISHDSPMLSLEQQTTNEVIEIIQEQNRAGNIPFGGGGHRSFSYSQINNLQMKRANESMTAYMSARQRCAV